MTRGLWREYGVVTVLCGFAAMTITYVGMAGFRADDDAIGDNLRYTSMALGGRDTTIKPFRYRFVVPDIVHLMPSLSPDPLRSAQLGLALVDVVALCVAGVALYALFRTWGAHGALALVGVAGFYLSHTILRFGGIPLIDSSACAVLILAMLAVERGWHVAVVVIVLVGMFVKETTVLVLVFALLTSRPWRARFGLAACALPGVVAYAVYRLVIDPYSSGYTYGAFDWVHNLRELLTFAALDLSWRPIILSMGPFWLFLALGIRRGDGLLPRRYLWFLAVCAALPVLLSTDYERVLFLAYPVVAAMSLPTIQGILSGEPLLSSKGSPALAGEPPS